MANLNPEDMEEMVLTLELEDGGEMECEVICIFEYDGKDYAALTPTDEDSEDLYIFGAEINEQEEGTEITFENIEDDELLETLFEALTEAMEEEEDDSEWDEFIDKKLED